MPRLFGGAVHIKPHSQGRYKGARRAGKGQKGASPFSGRMFRGGLKFGGWGSGSGTRATTPMDNKFSIFRWK